MKGVRVYVFWGNLKPVLGKFVGSTFDQKKNDSFVLLKSVITFKVPYYKKLRKHEIKAVCASSALISWFVKFICELFKWYITFPTC